MDIPRKIPCPYEEGYLRGRQDAAKEIFTELLGPVNELARGDINWWGFVVKIAELNKKFTEGETDGKADH